MKPTAAIQMSKKDELGQILFQLVLSTAAFATLHRCIPQGSKTAALRAGRRYHRGTLTCLFLPPFSPPSPHFHTAPFWAVTVLAMLALDKWMIYRLKVIRKCFLYTLLLFAITLPNTRLKKINLFSSNMITGY